MPVLDTRHEDIQGSSKAFILVSNESFTNVMPHRNSRDDATDSDRLLDNDGANVFHRMRNYIASIFYRFSRKPFNKAS